MAIAKLPCFNYQAMTAGKEQDFGLKPAEIRPIWEYAKKRYLDNGISYEETIDALSRETGAPHRFFAEVFTGPKTGRIKTIDLLRKEDARRMAKYKAQQYIAAQSTPAVFRGIYKFGQLPKAALTLFHAGVFPVTHAGGLLLRPSAWGTFLRGEAVTWKSWFSKAAYERERLRLFSEPDFAQWKGSGLRISLSEQPQGILAGLTKQAGAKRAWLGLMRMRYDLASKSLARFKWTTPEEKLDIMRNLAEIANHATGVTNINVLGSYLSRGLFAPQLTMSKWMRVSHDLFVTVRTFSKMLSGRGSEVSAGERAAASIRLRNAVEMLSTWAGGLYLNDQLLQMMGSDQRINILHPEKSDWLKFKTGTGLTMATRGPEEALRLYGALLSVGWRSGREIHGRNPFDEFMDSLKQYALQKLSPGIQLSAEAYIGTDPWGRPLPSTLQAVRGAVGLAPREERMGKPQLTGKEWLATQFSPIFVTGAARDMYKELRDRGLSEPDSQALMRAAILAAAEYFGFGFGPEPKEPVQPTRAGQKKPVKRI